MDLTEDQKKDLMELQNLQQQMQLLAMQKQQLLIQQSELEKASAEVEKASGQVYKIAGSILVQKDKATLQAELKDDLESAGVRLNAFSKQEAKIKLRFEELRKKLEKSLPMRQGDESMGA